MRAWIQNSLLGVPSPSSTLPSGSISSMRSRAARAGLARVGMRKRSVPGRRALTWPKAVTRPAAWATWLARTRSWRSSSSGPAGGKPPLRAQAAARRALHEALVEQLVQVVALGRRVPGLENGQGVLEHDDPGVGEGRDDLLHVVAAGGPHGGRVGGLLPLLEDVGGE